jgi:hypothetical protein
MKRHLFVLAVLSSLVIPTTAFCQLYSENFDVDPTANWTVNSGPSITAADFFYDYSAIGIPAAPSGGGTRGLKLQANLNPTNNQTATAGTFGGLSVSPTGQDFSATANYKLTFDWWANANGPMPVGGNGSTQLSTYGIQTAGATAQWPGGTQDSIWFGGTGDGQSSADWRAYSPTAGASYQDGNPVYAAPVAQGAATRNNTNTYYHAEFTGYTPPAAQAALYPQQTGTTALGAAGFKWHQVEIAKLGANVTYKVNGFLIATVPVADDTVAAGGNIFFGHSDINLNWSTDDNHEALLFTLIDNVKVSAISAINADFSASGGVDAADYAIWRKHFGVGTTQPQGDSDGDGDVDPTDYNNWRATFGNGGPGSGTLAGSSVPEPSTFAYLCFGFLALTRRRSRQ